MVLIWKYLDGEIVKINANKLFFVCKSTASLINVQNNSSWLKVKKLCIISCG